MKTLQPHTPQAATPWDALLPAGLQVRLAPIASDVATKARYGTQVAALLAELAACGSATTRQLAVRFDLTTNQVWGRLKGPRAIGQVRFSAGRWELVADFAGGPEVERAAALLRAKGWRVEPPND